MTRARFRRALAKFEAASRDREAFRRACVEFFEIELRKPVRIQEWVLWAVLRDVAFEHGIYHVWQNAYDHVSMSLEEDADEDFRVRGRKSTTRASGVKDRLRDAMNRTTSRRPAELVREYERLQIIKERHAAIKARHRPPEP